MASVKGGSRLSKSLPEEMPGWERHAPPIFSIVTGFFPETSPKRTWATNPRPLLVCGTAKNTKNGMIFCRVAYGTTKKLYRASGNDLVIANLSLLNQLCLKNPTRFVIHTGRQMAIMPWIEDRFRPWSGRSTPILSYPPEEVRRFVSHTLGALDDLPKF